MWKPKAAGLGAAGVLGRPKVAASTRRATTGHTGAGARSRVGHTQIHVPTIDTVRTSSDARAASENYADPA